MKKANAGPYLVRVRRAFDAQFEVAGDPILLFREAIKHRDRLFAGAGVVSCYIENKAGRISGVMLRRSPRAAGMPFGFPAAVPS